MQAATHFAFGATVSGLCVSLRHGPSWRPASNVHRVLVACFIAMFTHVLLDDLARVSYHPVDPLPDDGFWLTYVALSTVVAAALAIRFRKHGWVVAAAVLPDADWFVARPFDLWEPGALHGFFRSVPGIAQVSETLRATLPDWRTWPWAAAGEIVLLAGLVLVAVKTDRPGLRRVIHTSLK